MRESSIEDMPDVPEWGLVLSQKVDALGTKFDTVYAELTRRVNIQRKVISAGKMLAPALVAYLAGRYPNLKEPLGHILQLFGGP